MKQRGHLGAFFAETDKLLLLLCLLASAFGGLMVYSATRVDLEAGQLISRDVKTMIIAVAAGVVIAIVVSLIDYSVIGRLYPLIAVVCLGLMAATLVWGVGPADRQDAKTWLSLGSSGLYFQPSELLKIGFIITFSVHLDSLGEKIKKPLHVLLLLVHGAVPVVLVAKSGDMGSALVFMMILIVMLFCGGLQLRYFFIGLAACCALVPLAWKFVLKDLQKERFLGLLYPDRYPDIMYQQNKGITAIGSGKFWGQGLFKGVYTQAGVVPESENDMIFTTVGEELGFFGCICLMLLLLLIVLVIIRNGAKCSSCEGRYMCYGMAAMIASQAIINIGMCLKLLPVIGITLPFFSAGGSSNLCIYIGIGIVMSVHRYSIEHDAVNFRLGFIKRGDD